MIFERFFKGKNSEAFDYDQSEIDKISNDYLRDKISIKTPTVVENIDNIYTITYLNSLSRKLSSEEQKQLADAKAFLDSRNINPKTYLEDLAKVNIFISKTIKCPNDFTKEMLIESAFASFQYQKENNLAFDTFDKFFSTEDGHPFLTQKIKSKAQK